MKHKRAFSLAEFIVVMGIIAILMSIAVPYYADYANKSKVALAALVLAELNDKAMALYNEGLISTGITTLNIDGTVWTDATQQAYDRYPVEYATVYLPGDGTVNDNAWMFCVNVADLSVTGYVDSSGPYSRLCSKVVVDGGLFTTYCGRYSDSTTEIPLEYLPDECNQPLVSSF